MKKISSIIMIALLLASIAFTFSTVSLASAQESSDPVLDVGWEVVNTTKDVSHDVENSMWLFGPQPSMWVGYAEDWEWNGTTTAEHNFKVEAGDQLLLNITVPWEFLGDYGFDSIAFWGQTWEYRKAIFGLEYNATSEEWNSLSFFYEGESQEPSGLGFLTLNETHSVFVNDTDNSEYDIVFALTFIEEVVTAVFWTGMHAIDTNGKPVSPSWLTRVESGAFETPPFGLGVEVSWYEFTLPRYYYAEVVDELGEIMHYVDYGDPFRFRMAANVPFGEIEVPFCTLSWADEYMYNYNWTIKKDPTRLLSPEIEMIGMPLWLFFIYNSTGPHAVAGYIDNVTWTLIPIIRIWTVHWDVKLDHTINVEEFYQILDLDEDHEGAEVWWEGNFTEKVDMHPSDYVDGATIRPDPYFWTAKDTSGRDLHARREINEKNTVQLAFRSRFIEAFVRNAEGDIAERAMPGEVLNVTLEIHAPRGLVNGTYYILVNETNVEAEPGLFINIDGVMVNRTLHNFTISFEGANLESNDTHYWHTGVRHDVMVDFLGETITDISYNRVFTYLKNDTFVDFHNWTSTTMVDSMNWELDVGDDLSTLRFDIMFTAAAPSAKIDKATAYIGFWEDYAMNLSLVAAPDDWIMMYMGNETQIEHIEDDMLWSPRRLVFGDVVIWEPQVWTVTEDGALDLDGNIFTTEDQYFVKRTGEWHDWGNVTLEGMAVGLDFDPSPDEDGDEFLSLSWMGVVTMLIEYEATESFLWYHASDWSLVGSEEMGDILDILWVVEGEIPAPGYGWIAWTSIDRTIDLSGIPGLESGEWSNTWFAWGTEQAFQVTASENTQEWAAFQAKYAGLLLFNDLEGGTSEGAPDFSIVDGQVVTDEVTHFVLIDDVDSIELRRPFGATNNSGQVSVTPDTPVEFGISIYDVNVTIYPLRIENSDGIRGAWQFRESYEGAVGLNSTNFDYWITRATVEEMSFDISFNIDMVEYDPDDETRWNHAVSFKVDQVFGEWTLHDFDNSVLENRSLAVNFFGILGTATRTQYSAEGQPVTDTNSASTNASYYEFGAENSPYANVSMGGLPYTWGGDDPPHSVEYISGSSTAPIGAFSIMYESASGESVTNWEVEASMLFMTAGYKNWGGHEIRCDPVFVAYTSAHQTGTMGPTGTTTTTGTTPPYDGDGLIVLVGGAVILIVLVVVLLRRRR